MCAAAPLILVVDDDTAIRDSLSELLVDEGYQVAAVENGREALDYLRQRGLPCLILLDLMMPVMDGFEFIGAQQADPALADIPVVVITAAGEAKAKSVRASQVLPKPLRADQLISAVKRFC
jgi:CheY-like chemotaxis protein